MRFNRLSSLLGAAAVVLVLGSACDGAHAHPTVETPVDPVTKAERSIVVSGIGEVLAEPDIAELTVGVEVRAKTVAKARREAAERANAVVAVLRAKGVNEQDIRTINFQIRPIYASRTDGQTLLASYVVSNDVKVTVRDIEWVGELIDEVSDRVGDSIRISNLYFAHEDPTALTQQARELAIADARSKAQQLAEHSGVTLGRALTIVETSWAAPLSGPASRAEMAVTAIQAGSSAVSVSVQTTWEILED